LTACSDSGWFMARIRVRHRVAVSGRDFKGWNTGLAENHLAGTTFSGIF